MDPQADSTARMAGTPAKANRNAADGDAESAHVSTPSADKAMLLSSPAAFSFARKHPPALSSKPRKATSLFRHPASEAGKKGNEYKNGASSPVTHEGTVSKSGADGDASSSGTAFAVAAEQDGGARTHGAASALSWDGRSSGSGGAGEGSGSGSGGVACFGSPVRPPRENASSFRFTPQRNLNGLFASPVPPPPPTPPPPVTGDDLPLGLGNSDRKETVPPGGPTDDLSMLRFPARMQQASETEPSAGGAAPCRLDEAQPPSPPPPQSQSQWESPSRPQQARTAETTAAQAPLPQGTGDDMETKDKPAPASPEEFELELELAEAVAGKAGGGAREEQRSVAASEVCVSNEALRSSDGEAMCTLEVLVKHTRERVGVSALECWRVAELKRRLVYLKLFAAPEAITLVPRLGGPALEDDVPLGALDVDATYEARTVTFPAAVAVAPATN